jgi:catechol 2,3-dioxygenase-like lactoylglutathione lyase family enzyme
MAGARRGPLEVVSQSAPVTEARLLRLDHVQLAMPAGGEPEAVAFYEGLLGLRSVPKPPVLAARGGCWFEQGPVVVHLGVDERFVPATKAHPAFVVDDLDQLAGSLAAGGAPLTYDDALEGVRRGYVADPFGNRIELIEESQPS